MPRKSVPVYRARRKGNASVISEWVWREEGRGPGERAGTHSPISPLMITFISSPALAGSGKTVAFTIFASHSPSQSFHLRACAPCVETARRRARATPHAKRVRLTFMTAGFGLCSSSGRALCAR